MAPFSFQGSVSPLTSLTLWLGYQTLTADAGTIDELFEEEFELKLLEEFDELLELLLLLLFELQPPRSSLRLLERA